MKDTELNQAVFEYRKDVFDLIKTTVVETTKEHLDRACIRSNTNEEFLDLVKEFMTLLVEPFSDIWLSQNVRPEFIFKFHHNQELLRLLTGIDVHLSSKLTSIGINRKDSFKSCWTESTADTRPGENNYDNVEFFNNETVQRFPTSEDTKSFTEKNPLYITLCLIHAHCSAHDVLEHAAKRVRKDSLLRRPEKNED